MSLLSRLMLLAALALGLAACGKEGPAQATNAAPAPAASAAFTIMFAACSEDTISMSSPCSS